MDLQKGMDDPQQRIEFLEKKLQESQERVAELLKIIGALDKQVFCCKQDSNQDVVITFNEGKLAEEVRLMADSSAEKPLVEIVGEALYNELKPNYDKAFKGEVVSYGEFLYHGRYYSTVLSPLTTDGEGRVLEVLGNSQDITEVVKSKEESRKHSWMLKRIIEFNPYSIQLLDAEGHHISGNKAFLDLFLFAPPKEWSIFKDPFIRNIYGDQLFKVLDGEKLTIPPTWYNGHLIDSNFPDNPICIGSVMFPIFSVDGELEHIVIMHEDITIRVRAEEELVKAKEKAEKADYLKSVFLANISHEIRTPMNGILGFAELLKTRNLSGEKQMMYINIIGQSGGRMLNIINDLINISKIQTGVMEVVYAKTDINGELNYLRTFFELEARNKGLQLMVSKPPSFHRAIITTDGEKVNSILTNLIKNAIKFTNEGHIEFGYTYKGGMFEFFVKDTGVGIKPEKQKVVFDRFVQADSSLSSGYEGSGLGLSISKAYVELLGGTIFLESEVGVGTQFYFTIPDQTDQDIQKTLPEVDCIDLKGKMLDATILVVEDDETSLMFLSQTLEACFSNLLIARNGEEAIEICRKNPEVKLVLMDIKMPGMDGHTAAIRIKEFRPDLPIIAQTAFAFEADRDKYGDVFDDYLTKPIRSEELKSLMISYLKIKEC